MGEYPREHPRPWTLDPMMLSQQARADVSCCSTAHCCVHGWAAVKPAHSSTRAPTWVLCAGSVGAYGRTQATGPSFSACKAHSVWWRQLS